METDEMKRSFHINISVVIILSALLTAFAIYLKPEGRYQFIVSTPPRVIWMPDTRDGTVVDMRSSNITKMQEKAVKASY